ncbi:LysR family transcriptional regulator [uncultured Paracoccus sp.]|uniref:LysR family transcriptional regulator n=1 Tax=uncultured Paracoccus sp. TaxID=189685 RepID=UPI00262D9A77|nr:LysR family transcriptional regulator [uncultured Paracoccus sp.]
MRRPPAPPGPAHAGGRQGGGPADPTLSPTLDQLQVFLAIVDTGSFGAAARHLGRATSVISYAIAHLEGEMGVVLFDREGSRKPRLTSRGQALLADIRRIGDDVDRLRARVAGLRQGVEPTLSLALDVMAPMQVIAALLRDFAAAFPTVPLQLHVEALGGPAARLMDDWADLAVTGPIVQPIEGTEQQHLGAVTLVPVCAPDHPLAVAQARPGMVRDHLQVVLTDWSELTMGRDFSVLSTRTWRIADLSAKHALLSEGIGWGNMPLHLVRDDLAAGRLVHLALPEAPKTRYDLLLLTRRGSAAGPAARWLIGALMRAFCQADGTDPATSSPPL